MAVDSRFELSSNGASRLPRPEYMTLKIIPPAGVSRRFFTGFNNK
jgi:hypothetical protein